MENLEYKIVIAASAKTVWDTMLQRETYKQWVGKSWPNSSFEGEWKKGTQIRFVGPEGSGTLAEVVELKPLQHVLLRHIAALAKGGVEDRTSDMAKSWNGSIEEYKLNEQNGNTTVTVNMQVPGDWRDEFNKGWPLALQELKKLSERQLASV